MHGSVRLSVCLSVDLSVRLSVCQVSQPVSKSISHPRQSFCPYENDSCSQKLSFRLFADDTNIFISSDNSKQLETIINQELFKVKAWCDVNKLSINFSKTNFMIIKSPQKRLNTPINIIFHVVIVR